MEFIQTLLTKINGLLFPKKEEQEERYVCLFLKKDTDFILLSNNYEKTDDPSAYRPLIIKLDPGIDVETDLNKIREFLFLEYSIDPDDIFLAQDFLSLSPLSNKVFYFAIIEIDTLDTKVLLEHSSGPYFTVISLPYITLKADHNIFFNNLIKIL